MQPSEKIDQIIHAKWLIPVVPKGVVLENYCLAISDKKITAICPSEEARFTFSADREYDLKDHVLIPGLINSHGHASMSLLRGTADDIPLKDWLENYIWPLENEFVNEEFVEQGATLAIAEMITSGTTCFADMYFFPDAVARAATEANIRVQLACPVLDFPTAWAKDAEEYIYKATKLHDDFRNSDLIYTAFGPHAPYTVSDAPLQKISILAEELDLPIHIHIHETRQEVADALAADGMRPIDRLHKLGLITPRLVCIHATQLTDDEISLLSQNGASVVHCPESNMKLASGLCEVSKLSKHGVNVALGTDGCASNNDLNMFSEMHSAALLGKIVADDASAVPAQQALEMATINGAKALGLGSLIGSLEIGKYADITAVDLNCINAKPIYNPVSQLVYATQAIQVSHVWCGGSILLENGKLQTIDYENVAATTTLWQQRIARK
jgi:5-methylthioadenosine/S-adenosylhomocysteine deaminase